MIPVGEWLPDLPNLSASSEALNVIPDTEGYRQFPSLGVYSTSISASQTTAKGFIGCKDSVGNAYDFVGTASSILQISGITWTSRHSGTATASTDWWEFAQWGEHIIAVNGTDATVTISLGATSFSALGGSPPIARHIAVVRDFVVMGNISTESRRVQWSGINDFRVWTGSATNLADFQDLLGDGGVVQKVVGGEYGLIFQERAIQRMTFTGLPLIFQFDKIDVQRGALASQSVVAVGNIVYFLSEDGFYVQNGINSVPIGQGKIDRFFFSDVDAANIHRVQGIADPQNRIVIWCYPNNGSGGTPNRLIIYNWAANKWSRCEVTVEMLCRFLTPGYTLDALDSISGSLDALPASLDDQTWMGGRVNLSAITTAKVLATFTGTAMNATVETKEVEHYPGSRTSCISVRPVVQGEAMLNASVGFRNIESETISYGASIAANATGDCPVRVNARYQRYRISTSGSFTHIIGARPRIVQEGQR